jgi:hypothetical protein
MKTQLHEEALHADLPVLRHPLVLNAYAVLSLSHFHVLVVARRSLRARACSALFQ